MRPEAAAPRSDRGRSHLFFSPPLAGTRSGRSSLAHIMPGTSAAVVAPLQEHEVCDGYAGLLAAELPCEAPRASARGEVRRRSEQSSEAPARTDRERCGGGPATAEDPLG